MTNIDTLERYWHQDNNNLKIIISISGPGDVIKIKGINVLKHLILIENEFFLQKFLNNIGISGDYIFIIQKKYDLEFDLQKNLKLIVPNCTIIILDDFKNGLSLTLFELKGVLDLNSPILFLNSDFIISWDSNEFISHIKKNKCDVCLVTYKSNLPKHSYCEINDGKIINVVEKQVISDDALVGIYFWSKSKILFDSIEKLINNNNNNNSQYYLSLTFNQVINENYTISNFQVNSIKILDSEKDLKFLI